MTVELVVVVVVVADVVAKTFCLYIISLRILAYLIQ
jgi:hypothetical protein